MEVHFEKSPSYAAYSDACDRQDRESGMMLRLVARMEAPFDEPDERARMRTIYLWMMLAESMKAEYTSTHHEHRGMLAKAK